MISGIIFDVDGVLLDSMEIWEHAGEWYLQRFGIAAASDLSAVLEEMTLEEGAAYLQNTYQLASSIPEIIAGINDVISDFYCRQVRLKEGVSEALAFFQQKHLPLTAATASDRGLIKAAFARLGILGYFSKIFTCSEIGAGKNSPDIYFAAQCEMGTRPADTWVAEDTLHSLRTAKQAGFRTVGIFDESSRRQQTAITELADLYLRDFRHPEEFYQQALQL